MVPLPLTISAATAILVGIIVLIWPKFLNLAVGFWLLIHGVLQLLS